VKPWGPASADFTPAHSRWVAEVRDLHGVNNQQEIAWKPFTMELRLTCRIREADTKAIKKRVLQ